MSKALKVVATIASVAAIIPGPWQPFAQAIAVGASIVSSLTQKKPPAQGNTSQVQIGANMPMPYVMGRTYMGGVMVHDVGYGPTIDKVPNPYSSSVFIWSGGGPVEAIEAFQADYTTISFSSGEAVGYYENFMWLDTQLGATPESSALSGPHGAIPSWSSSSKLSGYAAGLLTMKFDKKGKRYASGMPQFGAIIQGVKAYDAREDSSYPGGSGTHDFDDESTWTYTDNPGVHGPTYARGRYQNGKKVFGCGFGQDQIDWAAWVSFANICEANGWTLGGAIYEGPGISKWDNLKRICAAGAAEPCFVGGLLSVRFQSPKTALDTITADDLADGECVMPGMKSWRERKNGIIPRYRSESHRWEYVQSDLVSVSEYVTADGEEKNEEIQYDLVQDKDQAAQLASYDLVNAREFGPVMLPCKPRLIEYRPGEAIEVDIPELGLSEQLCVIRSRTVDPATGIVTLGLESETTSKHAFALGNTGTAPPTPTLTTGEDVDEILATTGRPHTYVVADEAEMLALDAAEGDTAVRTDLGVTFIHNGGTTGTAADWTELPASGAVTSVNGATGAVTLDAGDIGFTPAGGIAATDVQAAIEELDTEKAPKATPTFTGLVTIDGGQIKFPATAAPSADANTLDDYEEGTFTPTLTFGGGSTGMTLSAQQGRYTKIGRLVHVDVRLILTAVGSSTGNASIGGLPFTAAGVPLTVAPCLARNMTTVAMPVGLVAPSATTITLYDFTGSTYANLTHADFTNTSEFYLSATYSV